MLFCHASIKSISYQWSQQSNVYILSSLNSLQSIRKIPKLSRSILMLHVCYPVGYVKQMLNKCYYVEARSKSNMKNMYIQTMLGRLVNGNLHARDNTQ